MSSVPIVGLDLGSVVDYTALAVAERTTKGGESRYAVTHMERISLGTSYMDILGRVCAVMSSTELRGAPLIVDSTGVGKPVLDLFKRTSLRVHGVTITGGKEHSRDGADYLVPKRDLIMNLLVLLQGGRLLISSALPDAKALLKELLNVRVRVNIHSNVSFEAWRENVHDDLVLALSMACWYGENAMHDLRFRWVG